ncbi:MAG: hypothetical protein HXY40_08115 [Chloroflexi bacterium]|nr:hypothetical protein [Chloroflexota bacterium]
MAITYTVAVDFNDDGDFVDLGEALSADVVALKWRLGLAAPYDSVAALSWAQISLYNVSQRYAPEAAGALALLPGRRLQISSYDGSATRVQFTGFIERVEPSSGTLGPRTALIYAVGAEKQLAQSVVRLAPQVGVSADTVIGALLDAVPLRRPVLKGYAILDRIGNAELNSNSALAGFYPRTLQSGKSTFAYVGDTWDDGITAEAALRQVVESERGRFFFNRAGDAVFYNRHHMLLTTTAQAAFDNNADALAYSYGADVANRVVVTLSPRSIGAAGSVLWQVDSAQQIAANSRREIVARYRDADKRGVGALSVLPPQAGLDYTANTAADGSGTDVTALVNVALQRADFSAATLTVSSSAGQSVYLLAGMRLRGTPLYSDDPLTIEQTDWMSLTLYGPCALQFVLPAITSAEEAEQIARYELARRVSPRGVARAVRLSALKHSAQILTRTLFERITLKDAQTGHDADYFIVAEEHSVDLGGARNQTEWLLETAQASTFALLNSASLNAGYALAY